MPSSLSEKSVGTLESRDLVVKNAKKGVLSTKFALIWVYQRPLKDFSDSLLDVTTSVPSVFATDIVIFK